MAGWLHFQYAADCQAANPTYGYTAPYGCNNNWGNIGTSTPADFSQIGYATWYRHCYQRVFASPPPSPPPPSPSPPPPSPPPPSPPPPSPPARGYQALSPSGYKCQGFYVEKYDFNSPYSAASCLALCTQSADCGATTFR
eukprot:scaffold86804_cov33-Phaeocystis_antarctica.AAC.1